MGRRAEDLRKIDNRVTRDRERKLGLLFTGAFDANHHDRASIQNGGKRSDPGLVVVLRAKIGEHGIREMTLHELGAPKFPLLEEKAERLQSLGITVTAKQFASGGRCTGAGIEERDIYFAFGERAIDEGQIADDGSKKSETKTCFGDDQGAGQTGPGNHIAETEGEECRAAKIDIRLETCLASGRHHGGPCAILHKAEPQHEANGPDPYENEEREWAIETQHGFARLRLGDEAHHEFPSFPGGAVKKAREAELPRDAARQDDGLERVPKHDEKDRDTRRERSRSWNHVGHCTCFAF